MVEKKYYSTAKPYYRFDFNLLDSDLKQSGFDKEPLLIDNKCDGLRITLGNIDGKGFVMVDPAELKRKNPDVSDRLPDIVKELELYPNNTIFDAELLCVNQDWSEVLHRTTTNSLLNATTFAPDKLSQISLAYVFRILFLDDKDIRSYPLKEEIELRSKLNSQKHIHIEQVSTDLNKRADGYVINGSNKSDIDKAINNILNDRNILYLKKLAEGVMIKLLNHPYETPQNKGWAKVKKYHELDVRVLGRQKVKGSKDTFNYFIGLDITKDYYDHLPEENRVRSNNNYFMYLGKTDNTNIKVDNGKILRIAAEEVLRYDNGEYPYYKTYVARAMEPVPEKNVSDDLNIVERLSLQEPKRVPIQEIERWEVKKQQSEKLSPVLLPSDRIPKEEDIQCFICPRCKKTIVCGITEEEAKNRICPYCGSEGLIKKIINKSIKEDVQISKKEGKIPDEIYEKYAKVNEPLPKEFYVDQREGDAWVQAHFRGILPEDVKDWKDGKKSLVDVIENHGMHNDLRMDIGLEKLIQWVITQNSVEDYIRTWKGEIDPKTGNTAKGLAIVKPSALLNEPEEVKKANEELLDRKSSELISKYILEDESYIIPAGEVGATKDKDAYMALIWKGKVKTGVNREDLHEYFFYPDKGMPSINQELINGRYICRCFKLASGNKWWFFKASGGEEE